MKSLLGTDVRYTTYAQRVHSDWQSRIAKVLMDFGVSPERNSTSLSYVVPLWKGRDWVVHGPDDCELLHMSACRVEVVRAQDGKYAIRCAASSKYATCFFILFRLLFVALLVLGIAIHPFIALLALIPLSVHLFVRAVHWYALRGVLKNMSETFIIDHQPTRSE